MKLNYTIKYKCEYLELNDTDNYIDLFVEPYCNLYNLTFPSRPQLSLGNLSISTEGLEVNRNDIEKMLRYLDQCSKKEFNKFFMLSFGSIDNYRVFYSMLIRLSVVPYDYTNNGIIKLLAF